LARLVSNDLKLEAGRGGGILVFFSPERAFAKSIGDEPLESVPEFLPGFRGDVLAVGSPAAGAAPPAGGLEGEPIPGANGEGVKGGLGGLKGCGVPFLPPLPGSV